MTKTRTSAEQTTLISLRPDRSERWLVCRDGAATKLWFARLEGATWTATWGRRGRGLQSRTYRFEREEDAWGPFTRRVQDKLDGGYVDAPEGAAIAEVPTRTGWRIERSPRSPLADQIGGAAPLAAADVPACAQCELPMTLLAVFHASPNRLPLGDAAALALFQCERGGGCTTWDADSGANAALLVARRQLTRTGTQPAETRMLERRGVLYTRVAELDPGDEQDAWSDPDGDDAYTGRSPKVSKVGGFPVWLQAAQVPVCAVCRAPMQFAAQLDGDDVGANFGDDGVGYAFVCVGHGAKFLWQCA